MMFVKTLLTIATVITFASLAGAQVPAAQSAPAKVGLVTTAKFSAATGGVPRIVNALRTLETEFKPKRDEINQLVTRLNTLQQIPTGTTQAQLATRREQAETLQIEITRKQEDARAAYAKRLSTLTDPIRLSVSTALEAFAKQRAVDVLIDISKFQDGILILNQNVDLTDAFIRDFNSRNP